MAVRRLRSAHGGGSRRARRVYAAPVGRSRPPSSQRHVASARPAAAVAAELGATAPVNFTTLLLMCFRTAPIMHGEPVETRLTRGSQTAQLVSVTVWAGWFKNPLNPDHEQGESTLCTTAFKI